MTLEVIKIIALLCNMNISTGSNWVVDSGKEQHECQKYYVKCMLNDGKLTGNRASFDLKNCILKKEVK